MPNYIPEFQGYSGQGAFRYWCQKVLPLVYDDSLSYYELLNKMVVYLNNTIADVAKAEGNIDSLLTAYTQLQNYVNNYFDNLDVQEEINNKLDWMAEHNQLTPLIQPFIPGLVDDWLDENVIIPEGGAVTLDPTLTSAVQAAQAKATGDEIAKAIKSSMTYISHDDLKGYTTANNFENNSVIGIGSNVLETDIANLPLYGVLSYVITTSFDPAASSKCQLYMGVSYFAMRVKTANTWGAWKISANNADAIKYELQTVANYTSLAELPVNIVSVVNKPSDTSIYTDFPSNTSSGVVLNMRYSNNFMVQFFMCFQTGKIRIWWRIIDKRDNSALTTWLGLANLDEINTLSATVATKANTTDVVTYELYDLSQYASMAATPLNKIRSFSAANVTWTDIPPNLTSGVFYNMQVSDNYKIQIVYEYQGAWHLWFRIVGVDSPYNVLVPWHKMLAPEDLTTIENDITALENDSIKLVESGSTYKTDNNLTSASQIRENVVMLGQSATYPDLPYANGVFLNLRYSHNFNIQYIINVPTGKCLFRVTDRRDGSVFTDWTGLSLFDIKNVLALGDSICYGARNGKKGFIGYFNLSVTNESRVAARLSNTRINEDDPNDHYTSYCIYKQLIDFATKSENANYVPDVIISDGGINDYAYVSNSVQLGTFNGIPKTTDTECESLDLSTIAGGTEYLFYNMIKYYPSAQRFFVLTHRTNNYPYTQNTNGYTQTDAFNLIKDIAKVYGVYIIDVFNESMLNTAFAQYVSPIPYSGSDPSATADEYVNNDGIHPLDRGYRECYVPLIEQALRIGTNKS